MRLLLDTHVFIWWADDPKKLSPAALAALEDEGNELLMSVASVWEMQIKIQLGKLKLSLPLKELVRNQQETNNLTVSPVALPHEEFPLGRTKFKPHLIDLASLSLI